MLKVKALILLFVSGIILLSDIIITPYQITYSQKPILAFLGILFVSYLDTKMIEAKDSVKLRKLFYKSITAIFVLSIISGFILRQPIPSFPFIVGCFIQVQIYLRGLRRAQMVMPDNKIDVYESPMPDIGFKVMSFVLFVRDLMLNHKKLLESVGLQDGHFVLDYGCGPGSFTFAASKIVRDKGIVYALDNQRLAIDAVNAKIKKHDISNIKTIYTNQGETGLPDKSIDYVMLIGVLHAVRKPDKILKEIKRVLKENGKLLLVSVHLQERELLEIVSPLFELEEKVRLMYIMRIRR